MKTVILGLGLAVMTATGLATSPAASSSSLGPGYGTLATDVTRARPALVVGPVGFSDVYGRTIWGSEGCNNGCNRTMWAFKVTNPSKTKTALNVRARIVLRTQDGTPAVDTIIPVAGAIPPKKSVWVTPANGANPGDGVNYQHIPAGLDSIQAAGAGVASADTPSIVSVSWKDRKVRMLRPLDLSVTPSAMSTWVDRQGNPEVNVKDSVFLPNAGKPVAVWSTVVYFGPGGQVLGGSRLPLTVPTGGMQIDRVDYLPQAVANTIASASLYSVPQ